MGRYVEMFDRSLFDSSLCYTIGERAGLGMRDLFISGGLCPTEAHLAALSAYSSMALPAHAAALLGAGKARALLSKPLPGLNTLDHGSLHEHLCCDKYKTEHPEGRVGKKYDPARTRDLAWNQRFEVALPFFK